MSATDIVMTLEQASRWLPHARLVGAGQTPLGRVHTDTRSLQPGDFFVALKGEHFDANQFLAQAQLQGAAAALCEPIGEAALIQVGLPGLIVEDSRVALRQLARGWRRQFNLPLIAVTGSNGKTTVTQMIAAILRAHKPAAMLATQGNLNNDIGVPLTVLRLRAHTEFAVVELGMNHPGEIAVLADIAQPTVALVNNAQREHLEFMSSVDAVASENGAVLSHLPIDGVAVFPADDPHAPLWRQLAQRRTQLGFGFATPAEVRCDAPLWQDGAWKVRAQTPSGLLEYRLNIAGLHNVKNSLAALSCALAAKVPLDAIAHGLSIFEPVKGRSRAQTVMAAGHSVTLVDDSYNANPDSVKAAIDVLASLPGPRLLILGDMGEVGHAGPQLHAEVGEYARHRGIELFYGLGDMTAGAVAQFGAGRHFKDMAALNNATRQTLPQLGSVLVKGSRFMRMEQAVQAILASTSADREETQHAH